LITGLDSPIFVGTPNHWINSASEPYKVTLNCYTGDGWANVTVSELRGVGVLSGVFKSDVVSDKFKLPAPTYGSSSREV
jgi:hypothetical protein